MDEAHDRLADGFPQKQFPIFVENRPPIFIFIQLHGWKKHLSIHRYSGDHRLV